MLLLVLGGEPQAGAEDAATVPLTRLVYLERDTQRTPNQCGGNFKQSYVVSADYPSGANHSYFTDLTSTGPQKLGFICASPDSITNDIALSPDRGQLAYTQVVSYSQVYVYDLRTQRSTPINPDAPNCYSVRWNPNGPMLSCSTGGNIVLFANGDYSHPARTIRVPNFSGLYAWLPDGSGIVYESPNSVGRGSQFPCPLSDGDSYEPSGLYRFDLNSAQTVPVVAPACSNAIESIAGVIVTPSGRIAYWGTGIAVSSTNTTISSQERLRLVNADGSNDHNVPVSFLGTVLPNGFCGESLVSGSAEIGADAVIVDVSTQPGIASGCDPNADFHDRLERIDLSSGARTVIIDSAAQQKQPAAPQSAQLATPPDTTAPTLTIFHTTDGQNGWNVSSPVAVTVGAVDVGDGLAANSPACTTDSNPTTLSAGSPGVWTLAVSGEGAHTVACVASDHAGNSATAADAVLIDSVPPKIIGSATPAANANGWRNSDVTVSFSCADGGSGVASCQPPSVLGQGAGQTVRGTASDMAGNSATTSLSGINVDETPPTLTGTPTTAPNGAGWYSSDVTVHWACSDGLSGIAGACPSDETLTGEGSALMANQSVSDLAGNVTAVTSAPVRIDRTPPTTTASAPSGWSNTGATVQLTAIDNLSGVDSTYYRLDGGPMQTGTSSTINDEGVHTIVFWSVDRAGNIELPKTVEVRIDKSAPTITHTIDPQPTAGWNKNPVTVSFICGDALSGLAFCTPSQSLAAEGQSQPVHGVAQDYAGNSAEDTAFVSIDLTPPTINADTDRPANAAGWFNAPVKVSFTCADVLSGIAACPAALTLGEGADQSASGTARDTAGNSASTTLAHINVDLTAPVVAYSGNAGTYTVDQNVTITCSAADALSGLASTTCANISGPAWSFGLGTTSRAASATDKAGNIGTGSTTFSVIVTSASLDALITQFFGSDTHGARGLIAKADAIASAPDANAKAGKLAAFDNQVDAKIGNPLTPQQATVLKQLAAGL